MLTKLIIAAAALAAATATPAPATLAPNFDIFTKAFTAAQLKSGDAPAGERFQDVIKHSLVALHDNLSAQWAALENADPEYAEWASSPAARTSQPSPAALELQKRLSGHSHVNPMPGPYWRWVPQRLGAALTGTPLSWAAPCFGNNQATLSMNATAAVLTITASAPINATCSDFYLVGTVDGLQTVQVDKAGSVSATVPVLPRSGSAQWIAREGVRVFQFLDSPWPTLYEMLATVSLFVPALMEPSLDAGSFQRNMDFIAGYANLTNYPPRSAGNIAMSIPDSYFDSGDLFAVWHPDGLGTLEQWGTGAATTHIVVGMRYPPDNSLYIVESTDKDSYWPNPNIQRTPFAQWVQMANAANYSVVHLPLTAAARANFNLSAAQAFVNQTLGLPYGYHTFISTFFDTPTDNLPWPATPEAIECVFGILEALDPSIVALVLSLSMNKKLGTTNLTMVEAANWAAANKGMTVGEVIAIPEQDAWVYPDGISLVCDSYYCAIAKAAGLFGDLAPSIQCTEFQNKDVYSLNFFDLTRQRPAVCAAADPSAPYCQLMGPFHLNLAGAASVAPYANMAQTCASLPTDYARAPNC